MKNPNDAPLFRPKDWAALRIMVIVAGLTFAYFGIVVQAQHSAFLDAHTKLADHEHEQLRRVEDRSRFTVDAALGACLRGHAVLTHTENLGKLVAHVNSIEEKSGIPERMMYGVTSFPTMPSGALAPYDETRWRTQCELELTKARNP